MRKGQYSLIIFIIATIILLSLSGIIVGFVNDKAEQIAKAQALFKVGDAVRQMRSIQREERQVGIDFTGVHLGALGGWPAGVSLCGSSKNDSVDWLFKSVPYWYSDSGVSKYYNYTPTIYAKKDNYTIFRVNNIDAGLYDGLTPPLLIDGKLKIKTDCGSAFNLEAGAHTFLFDKNNLCKHTVDCDCATPSKEIPTSLTLHRIIPPSSKYENCLPKSDFIVYIYNTFLNKYFPYMSALAYNYIKAITTTNGFVNPSFVSPLEYKAEINKVGNNSLFITFYPLNIPFWNIKYKGLSNISYQGSTISFDAFKSNFASFQHIAREVITKKEINDLVNSIITKHSSFNVFASIHIKGSYNKLYENFMNSNYDANWQVNNPDINDNLKFINIFGVDDVKPTCLYYLKEICQFSSDEVPFGFNTSTYINDSGNKNYAALYNAFTKKENIVINNIIDCKKCHDIGRYNNPCLNLSYDSCKKCFKDNMGKSYDDATDNECINKVNEQIKPLLNDYLIYRLNDIGLQLSKKYGNSWKVDAKKINITSIKFGGYDYSGTLFNSSCLNCLSSKPEGNCHILKSDLEIINVSVSAESKEAYECYKSGVCDNFNIIPNSCDDIKKICIITSKDGFLEMGNSENPLIVNFTVINKGNTEENFNLTILGDAFANLQWGSDFNYYQLNGMFNKLPTELPLSNNYENDRGIKDDDGKFDFRESYPIDYINKGYTKNYSKVIFSPSSKGLNTKSHLLRICVNTPYNDEWNWTNNCKDIKIGVCSSGDVSKSCCEDYAVGGVWLDSNYYGACCGDDHRPYLCDNRSAEVSFDEEPSNQRFFDKVNNFYWLSFSPIQQEDGLYGKAMKFIGNNYLFSPYYPYGLPTLSIVFKWEEGNGFLVDYSDNSQIKTPLIQLKVFSENNNHYLRYIFYPDNYWRGGNSFPLEAGKWYRVTLNSDGQTQYFYKNNDLVYTRSQTGSLPNFFNQVFVIGAKVTRVKTGTNTYYDTYSDYFKGAIDDIVIYNKPLNSREVRAINELKPSVCDNSGNFSTTDDDFMASDSAICYHGIPYYCPDKTPLGARVRRKTDIHRYDLPLSSYINYFCKGES